MVGVVVFSVVGAYAIRQIMFDVYVMFFFGIVGFYLESRRVPLAPLILGLILGSEFAEQRFRQGMIASGGDVRLFFTHSFCPILIALLLFAFLAAPLVRLAKRMIKRAN